MKDKRMTSKTFCILIGILLVFLISCGKSKHNGILLEANEAGKEYCECISNYKTGYDDNFRLADSSCMYNVTHRHKILLKRLKNTIEAQEDHFEAIYIFSTYLYDSCKITRDKYIKNGRKRPERIKSNYWRY